MSFIYTPAQSSTNLVKYAQHLKDTPGVPFGVPSLDKKVIPARPGDVTAFVARPGHGKSSLMSYLATATAKRIMAEGHPTLDQSQPGQAVLYVTWEQLIETQEGYIQSSKEYNSSDIHWGRADMEAVKRASVKRANLPLWVAGESYYSDKRYEPMYIDTLFDNIIEAKEKYNVQFELICFDYLQEIPVRTKGKEARHREVAEAIHGTKELAKAIKCPVHIGVQAKDAVDKTATKIPNMGDTYFTSELDHVIDKGFGLLKASRVYDRGETIGFKIGGVEYDIEVTDNLFIMNLFKQRHEAANIRFPLLFDMENMTLGDLELRKTPLDY